MEARTAGLQKLSQTLEELLAALDEVGSRDPRGLEIRWARCAQAFSRVEALHAARDRAALPSEELRRTAQAALRLQAVAASLAARSRDGVAHELGRLAEARDRLRAVRARGVTGLACNVEG